MAEGGNHGEQFLNEKYSDLANSPEVESAVHRHEVLLGQEKPKKKEEKVQAYLERLGEIFGVEDEDKKEQLVDVLKHKLHEKFVIKGTDMPESYFKNQQRIAREQGHGDIEITDEVRKQSAEVVINGQQQSLDNWVDYLGSSDAPYPDWLKYWTMRSIVRLTEGEKDEAGKISFPEREFAKHDKNGKLKNSPTIKPFPGINREALAYVLDAVEKSQKQKAELEAEMRGIKEVLPKDVALTKKQEQEIENRIRQDKNAGRQTHEQWDALLKSQNFADLYAHAIEKITPASEEDKEDIQGEWVKYDQGSDHKPLYESLQGQGTGWCTAGEGTAQSQLATGDFYVYYTGAKRVPRIAIRMAEDRVVEVRGIGADQNLEPAMLDIAREKYTKLPGGDRYEKRDRDMKQLTEIDERVQGAEKLYEAIIKPEKYKEKVAYNSSGPIARALNATKKLLEADLSKEEIAFLYEQNERISGFGYNKDPRVEALRDKRNKQEDIAKILPYKPEEIGFNKWDLLHDEKNLIKYIYGDLDLWDYPKKGEKQYPPKVKGHAWAEWKNSDRGFDKIEETVVLPEEIGGTLKLDKLESLNNIVLPKKIEGDLSLRALESLENVTFPEVGGAIDLICVERMNNVVFPKTLGGLYIQSLKTADNVTFPESVEDLTIPEKISKKLKKQIDRIKVTGEIHRVTPYRSRR